MAGPSVATVYYSFTDWSGLGPASFIGFDNYIKAFGDAKVHEALLHNLIWFVLFLSVPMAMGLLGAYLLSQVTRFQMLFRALYFIPYVVASVVNAAVWKMLLSPTSGIGHAARHRPVVAGRPGDLAAERQLRRRLALVGLPGRDLPRPRCRASTRSCTTRRKWTVPAAGSSIASVTLPGIRPTMVFIVLMTVIWSLKAFDYIFIMTQGGPAGSSEVVSTLMYKQAFNEYTAGYAAALGLSMTLVTAVILAGYQYLRRKGWEIMTVDDSADAGRGARPAATRSGAGAPTTWC